MMALLLACLLLFLALVGHSNAAYCICKDGTSDQLLQKNIDYACGNGADCTQILQTGSCYNPNTVKDHCNYAVNSYYQRKSSTGATCDFTGTCTLSPTIPNAASGCNYPSSASNAGTAPNNPSIAPPGSSTNPINPPTGGGTMAPGFGGLGPTGSGSGINQDSTGNDGARLHQGCHGFLSLALTLVVALSWFRV